MSRSLSHNRIKTLDVVRGLTMTLVVFHHVRGATFDLYSSPSAISEIFVALRMPMFFFISGFVASKAVDVWTAQYALKRMLAKVRVEMVPTVVFFTLFVLLTTWEWTFPGGYWFTVALTAMLGLYYLVSALSRSFFKHHRNTVLLTIGLLLYALMPSFEMAGIQAPDINKWFPAGKCSEFFIFFAIGVVCGGGKTRFLAMLERGSVSTAALAISVAALSLSHLKKDLALPIPVVAVLTLLGSVALVVIVLSAFWRARGYWDSDGRMSRMMQFVGRRTLDIYMIHWFLLPRIPSMKSLFWHRNNDILELLIIGGLSIAIVAACLLISAVIRTSPFFAKWLFASSAVRKSSRKDADSVSVIADSGIIEKADFPLPPVRRSRRDSVMETESVHWVGKQ